MNALEKESTRTDRIGISKIEYSKGDLRENPFYSFTFFRNEEQFVECIEPMPAEILMELLNIEKANVLT